MYPGPEPLVLDVQEAARETNRELAESSRAGVRQERGRCGCGRDAGHRGRCLFRRRDEAKRAAVPVASVPGAEPGIPHHLGRSGANGDLLREVEAMATVGSALDGLDFAGVSRVLHWAADRVGVLLVIGPKPGR